MMISVKEASRIILETNTRWGQEQVPLAQAIGRVLMEDLTADRDFPPYHRVSMDGIAIAFQSFQNGLRIFPVEGIQTAGSPQMNLSDPAYCLEVMTGAVLPEGTDTVIRYEDLQIEEGRATILIDDIRSGQNAHERGSDRKKGSDIVKAPQLLSAAEIGLAATIGKTRLSVAKNPKTLLVSTGDELVEIDRAPLPYQIRRSNVYSLQAALRSRQIPSDLLHLPDEKEAIHQLLKKSLENYDLIILSGGVSKGKLDFVPEVLEEIGVQKAFHKVQQRPGKPFWFGRVEEHDIPVFAFPGNPVSSFMCLYRYVLPWWHKSLGIPFKSPEYAQLSEDFTFAPDLSYFLQVSLESQADGRLVALPVKGRGSGDLANLVETDAFLELPAEKQLFKKGETYPCWRFR